MKFAEYFSKMKNLKKSVNFKSGNKIKGSILIVFPDEDIEREKRKNFISLILLFFNMDATEIFENENKVLQTVAGNYKKYNFFLDFFNRI